jgi:hypothetical protein
LPGSAVSATATTAVPLVQSQTQYYDRLNQLDPRLGKILKYCLTQANVSLDLYNLFNKGTIGAASATDATWLAPSAVISPRLMKSH